MSHRAESGLFFHFGAVDFYLITAILSHAECKILIFKVTSSCSKQVTVGEEKQKETFYGPDGFPI